MAGQLARTHDPKIPKHATRTTKESLVRHVEIQKLLKGQPFVGLRFCISDGRQYEVRHPDMVLVTHHLIHIALPPFIEGVATGENGFIDPLHVTRVEPLPARKPSRNGKSRSK